MIRASRLQSLLLLVAAVSWAIDIRTFMHGGEPTISIGWTMVPVLIIPAVLGIVGFCRTNVIAGQALLWLMFPALVFIHLPEMMDIPANAPVWDWRVSGLRILLLAIGFLLVLTLLRAESKGTLPKQA